MVLCFGELLLIFYPDTDAEWLRKNSLDVYLSGSEINVAAALAKWRVPVSYCTVVAENFLTKQLIKKIADQNIDVSTIAFSEIKPAFIFSSKHSVQK